MFMPGPAPMENVLRPLWLQIQPFLGIYISLFSDTQANEDL